MPSKHSVTEFLWAFQNRAQKFYDMSPDFFIELDSEGRIDSVNPSFCLVLGYTEGDVLHLPISRIVLIDDWAVFFRSFTNDKQPPFRLLHKHAGYVRVMMAKPPAFEGVREGQTTMVKKWKATLILRPV